LIYQLCKVIEATTCLLLTLIIINQNRLKAMDEFGVIYDANNIIPSNDLKLKFLEAEAFPIKLIVLISNFVHRRVVEQLKSKGT
jgi:ribonucleotide monophosphatase NagD (HAD superfamily)